MKGRGLCLKGRAAEEEEEEKVKGAKGSSWLEESKKNKQTLINLALGV